MSLQLVSLAAGTLLALRLFLNWSKHSSTLGPFLAGISDLWRADY